MFFEDEDYERLRAAFEAYGQLPEPTDDEGTVADMSGDDGLAWGEPDEVKPYEIVYIDEDGADVIGPYGEELAREGAANLRGERPHDGANTEFIAFAQPARWTA